MFSRMPVYRCFKPLVLVDGGPGTFQAMDDSDERVALWIDGVFRVDDSAPNGDLEG